MSRKTIDVSWIVLSDAERTGSSGDRWSVREDNLRLCAAHNMSRDFLRVSSILQAAKSDAAAAS